ncbi:hypothetical protein GGI12_001730 [Dipsacomyces acuminosporus]|nr:hypothetical protein GGI12_001730 [Dipsacomyces acuminosporus]
MKKHSIDGQVLVNLDHESLKDLGVRALGKRLLVLKSIYFLKLQHDIPITADSYVPQTVDVEPDYPHGSSFQRKQKRQTEESISRLMEEISHLYTEMNTMRNDMQRIYRLGILENKPLPALAKDSNMPLAQTGDPFGRLDNTRDREQSKGKMSLQSPNAMTSALTTLNPAMPSANAVPNAGQSPGSGAQTASFTSPASAAHSSAAGTPQGAALASATGTLAGTYTLSSAPLSTPTIAPHIRVYGDNALQRENEAYKSFRISVDDPCSKILPHALKKYHISDNWSNYTLCIQYGKSAKGKKFERELSLDEKPLYLFQQLKDAGESPVFVLKLKRSGGSSASPAGDNGASATQVYMSGTLGGSQGSLFSADNNGSSSSLESPIHAASAASSSSRPIAYLSTAPKPSSVGNPALATTPTSATLIPVSTPTSGTYHDAEK